jgi:hypothetical protein
MIISMRRRAALLACVAAGATTLGIGTATTVSASMIPEHLYVLGVDGAVGGTLSASASYTVRIVRGGVVKASASGVAGADGGYTTNVGYSNGVFSGIHNGDTVQVTDNALGATYSQLVNLTGIFEEDTGLLAGRTEPLASISARVYTRGDDQVEIGTVSATADSSGAYRIDVGAALNYSPPPGTGHPAWRGYEAEVVERDPGVTDRAVWHSIQTPNTDLVLTDNLANASPLLPGSAVSFALVRSGATVSTASGTVDEDGMAHATFGTAAVAGDRMVTTYHDSAGVERTQQLDPLQLTVAADNGANTVSGAAEPGSPVVVAYWTPSGQQVVHTAGDLSGHYSAGFADVVGGRLVVVTQIADPGFTGVGMYQGQITSPIVRVNDLTNVVDGYGAYGVAKATVSVVRNGRTVATASGTTTQGGKFSLTPSSEIVPGDTVKVTTGSTALPAFQVGSTALTAHRTGAASGAVFAGTAEPGRQISLTAVKVGGGTCVGGAVADGTGEWSLTLPCQTSGVDAALVNETVDGAANDATSGDVRGHFFTAGAPDVSLTSPLPLAALRPKPVSFTVDTFDVDDNSPPSKVVYTVTRSGQAPVDYTVTAAPFSLTLKLGSGSFTVRATAYDALGRMTPTGTPVTGQTAVRQFTVR